MNNYPINDPYFRLEVLSKTERPNLLSYLAMHQCYSEKVILDEIDKLSELSESELGDRIVKHCLKFGHWSVVEHPHITFCVSGFPHSVMAQATRHRLLSFSVQSQRYTCERVEQLARRFSEAPYMDSSNDPFRLMEKVFYFRPVGFYSGREGEKYEYTEAKKFSDMESSMELIKHYLKNRIGNSAYAPEHARDLLPQNIRQDFVVTFNARSLLHFCDLRLPKDAQPEIRTMAEMLFEKFKEWMPEVAKWYEKNRYAKNRLSP